MIIMEPVRGTIIEDDGQAALLLDESDSGPSVYLAYALVTQGPGLQILPSVVLDDWGNRIGGLELYNWIQEHGLRFPRAEVFGRSPTGEPVQYFLRDLELFAKYPVYAFAAEDAPVETGVLLQSVRLPDDTLTAAEPANPPDGVSALLRASEVEWRRVKPG